MNNNVYILKDRALLYVSGFDTRDFLQNLMSNDIYKVSDNYSCWYLNNLLDGLDAQIKYHGFLM